MLFQSMITTQVNNGSSSFSNNNNENNELATGLNLSARKTVDNMPTTATKCKSSHSIDAILGLRAAAAAAAAASAGGHEAAAKKQMYQGTSQPGMHLKLVGQLGVKSILNKICHETCHVIRKRLKVLEFRVFEIG